VRGLRYHVRTWDGEGAGAPRLVLLHGWMDVSASFQFLVDAMRGAHDVVAPDWRGYGLTSGPPTDAYWFADYLGDLDALLDALSPEAPVDLVAHSMGGNVAMLYAGARPGRVRRLVNLEGFGMRPTRPEQAPDRLAQWLDELRAGGRLRDYDSHEAVAERLRRNNPRLAADKAAFLAQHWARQGPGGRLELAADPAHRLVNPQLYRVDEVVATWRRIEAPVLLVQSDRLDDWHRFVREPEYAERLAAIARLSRATVSEAGHMLHHDQPEAVARLVEDFLA
jgi:pimeloyl-ACP methyl ester carboxylesterase